MNKLLKGLSFSANPRCLIKSTFPAATDVFASSFRKNDVCENNKHSTKLAGGTKQAILAPVILGPVPRILLQQGTNLVNKFALLLHKCRFAQDSRDKPENDGSWRCWLNICCEVLKHLLQVIRGPRPANLDCRITSGNDNVERGIDYKKKTTITFKGLDVVRQYAALLERRVQSRKAQAVTRQTKHIRNLLPQCASDATGFLSDVYKKSTRARKFLADGVQYGRSMIEMLGVLAIVGVLSVGGIAGYSKAMTQFKVNKIIAEINQIIATTHEYVSKNKEFSHFGLSSEEKKSLGLCPESWKGCSDTGLGQINFTSSQILLSVQSRELCLAVINNVAIPLKDSLNFVVIQSVNFKGVNSEAMKKCNDKFNACSKLSNMDEKEKCFQEANKTHYKCMESARGNSYVRIEQNYTGNEEYDESYKNGTLDFNDPRLLYAVTTACKGNYDLSSITITFKDGFIGN